MSQEFTPNDHDNFIRLVKELRDSAEQKRLDQVNHFQASVLVFDTNFKELKDTLLFHNDHRQSQSLWKVENRQLLHAYQLNVTRLLHNFVASAQSLIDHTRFFYRKLYEPDNLFPDYQEEIRKRFLKHTLSCFIKDLRQYAQHYQVPSLSSSLRYERGKPDFEVSMNMDKNDLLEFSGWKANSKTFLADSDDKIDVLKLFQEYHTHIMSFQSWFSEKQKEIHKNDFAYVSLMKSKLKKNELGKFVKSMIKSPKSIEEIEEELRRYYPEDEMKTVDQASSVLEKIKALITLLKNDSEISEELKDGLDKDYDVSSI